jgi:hypothetical protein
VRDIPYHFKNINRVFLRIRGDAYVSVVVIILLLLNLTAIVTHGDREKAYSQQNYDSFNIYFDIPGKRVGGENES